MHSLTEIYEAADVLWDEAQLAPLLTTGQVLCYNAGGTLIGCGGTGQDGMYQKGVAKAYENNGNGTVTDEKTGLIWQRCSRGQNNDAGCTGTATTANWETALSYCEGLELPAGTTDWRLPNIPELYSIMDLGAGSAPFINTTIFPSTVSSFYWSSTSLPPAGANNAQIVGFNSGYVTLNGKTLTVYVRCVRE